MNFKRVRGQFLLERRRHLCRYHGKNALTKLNEGSEPLSFDSQVGNNGVDDSARVIFDSFETTAFLLSPTHFLFL